MSSTSSSFRIGGFLLSQSRPQQYSLVCIFWSDMYFSKVLLSIISFPYLPTVPSSAIRKWECMLLSVLSLLSGLPRVWYRQTTWENQNKNVLKETNKIPSFMSPHLYAFLHYNMAVRNFPSCLIFSIWFLTTTNT